MKKLLFIMVIVALTLSLSAVDTVKKDNVDKGCCSKMDKSKCGKMKMGKKKMMHKKMQGMHMKMNKNTLPSYMSVQKALSVDDSAAAKEAFKNLSLNSEGDIKTLSEKAMNSKDIKDMRSQFKEISSKMAAMKLAKGFGTAYCPMAKAWWVQEKGNIKNPYYGKKMSDCGSFKEFKPEVNTGDHQH